LVLAVETLGDWEVTGVVSSLGSPLMVDVDDDRVKVWVKGARWVSFNSAWGEKRQLSTDFQLGSYL
jgi:hypothetical protein